MGSGLTGQPNAVLGMMNNQIKNDLDAQTKSKENAQNFLKINQQALLNQASIKSLNAETAAKSYALSNMQMNRAALHHLTMQAQNLPIGSPQRQQAEQTLAMMAQAVNGENYNIADTAAANSARMKMMMGDSDSQMDAANQIRRKQIMGFISPEQSKDSLREVGQTQNHVQLNQNALDSFDKVAKMSTLGNRVANPVQYHRQIDAEWNPMMDKLTKDTEGRVTPITVDMMGALKPALTDNAQTLHLKREKLSNILNAGFATPTLDSLGVKIGKGEYGGRQQGAGSAAHPLEGKTASDSNGNRIIMQGGRWVPMSNTAAK